MSAVRQTRFTRQLTAEQEPFLAIRSLASDYTSGHRIEPHEHGWHQFLYATSGAMTVSTASASWMIPTGRAVFIPARNRHAIRMWGTVEMRTLYFSPAQTALQIEECRVVDVRPLLRELILFTTEVMGLDTRIARDAHTVALLEDEVRLAVQSATLSLALPLPLDARALVLAEDVLADPLREEDLDTLAMRHGIARRTLERRFRDETGMSFGVWRQKVRLLNSIRLLAEGKSVTDAALDSGYSSVSAYIAAFKSTFGYTPGRILAE